MKSPPETFPVPAYISNIMAAGDHPRGARTGKSKLNRFGRAKHPVRFKKGDRQKRNLVYASDCCRINMQTFNKLPVNIIIGSLIMERLQSGFSKFLLVADGKYLRLLRGVHEGKDRDLVNVQMC